MENSKETIFVFGASGHAKVVVDVLNSRNQYKIHCIVDDNPAVKGIEFCGYHVIGTKEDFVAAGHKMPGIIGIGDISNHSNLALWLSDKGYEFVSAIHKNTDLGSGVVVDVGSVVMSGVVINADTTIGKHCIINTSASVDHDCSVGDYVHVAPGVTVCGGVSIGASTLVGAGATILPNITVGSNVVIGAGTTVVQDIPDNSVFVGPR